jgi:hypothetical protein
MAQQTADHCANPSEEVIRIGHLTVHFLVTGENSSGTVAVFEVVIPAGKRLMAPHTATSITRRRSMASRAC